MSHNDAEAELFFTVASQKVILFVCALILSLLMHYVGRLHQYSHHQYHALSKSISPSLKCLILRMSTDFCRQFTTK